MPAPTNMTPDWIARVVASNPPQELDGGNIRTGPVRLGFPHLETPQKAMEAGKPDKYTVTCLFQPGQDDSLFRAVAAKCGQEKWGDLFAGYVQQQNFHKPFGDQGDKSQYEGFEPGLPYITASGERKPAVVMQNMAPYTDRIYPGIWAFVIVRAFSFETRNAQNIVVKRGLSWGLQSVMIIADDVEFGGGGVDPVQAFAGVQIDANVNPASAFAQTGQQLETTAADIFR